MNSIVQPPVRPYHWIVVVLFALFMGLPLAATNFRPLLSAREALNQQWAEPGMDGFERWRVGFAREFGYRQRLVEAQAWLKLNVAQQSPTESVILGRDGWLFLGRYNGYDGMEDYLRTRPMTDAELSTWIQHFQAKRDALAARHIPYLLVFAPNKSTIYPEYMPAGLEPCRRPSRLGQLMVALQARGFDTLDLTAPLLAAKDWRRLYYKTDTHWNDAGGLVAYRTVLSHLQKSWPTLREIAPQEQPPLAEPATNLPRIAGVPDLLHEDNQDAQFKVTDDAATTTLSWDRQHDADPAHPQPTMYVPLSITATTHAGAPLQRGLFIGDSFLGYGFAVLLEQHFQQAERNFDHTLDLQQVDRLHPQLVMEEMVEEDLSLPQPRTLLP